MKRTLRAAFMSYVVFAASGAASSCCSYAQGYFENLTFESAISPLVPDAFGAVPASNAIPSWTAYIGGQPVSDVVYSTITFDAAAVALQAPGSVYMAPEGSYALYLLSATRFVPAGSPLSAAIGQTGTIPQDAQALYFAASFGVPQVSFAGQSLVVGAVGAYSSATLYGADISAYAGQSGELLFSVTRNPTGSRQEALLDAISFSSTAIPEPSVLTLLGLGLAGLICCRRRIQWP